MDLDIIHLGDCRDILKKIDAECIDLIITSPPYADNRQNNYVGIPIDDYVNWFLPISSELLRVLKPTGSFVLNIKERVVSQLPKKVYDGGSNERVD